ncbi:transcription elongation factor GreA [Deinococcus radiopugnans]|uniref:Transcription elongation factor GreA n=2 Tax=Deinococcus radiopugnans TaxID=57497 RepID=A0A0A7KI76_9DEIO|nr:GreA/GreB family elongation factor [Deinococcus radiopugnans]AIZ44273.1 transcription elongation factor GreA [Deinococcus radiopugnans]MBB6015676.1 transcription elongation factor GreA [Deinococcus radiopugnans ATCC 19172]QLG09842.1 GreA/GreB family elongation factor [Deinococcus sp. D7000]TNM72630.1 GreA family protein [Deinococcus radiopugnans ATCC 19172]
MTQATKTVRLTREGYERLQRALGQEQARLAEATRILQEQMETSSDTEDTGLEDAKREKMNIEARIDELEDTLGLATIIEEHENDGRVELGAIVVLSNETTKKETKVMVVSAPEAAVTGGSLPRVSEDSPVGKELMGRKKGEAFVVNLDNGKQMKYKVKSIEY